MLLPQECLKAEGLGGELSCHLNLNLKFKHDADRSIANTFSACSCNPRNVFFLVGQLVFLQKALGRTLLSHAGYLSHKLSPPQTKGWGFQKGLCEVGKNTIIKQPSIFCYKGQLCKLRLKCIQDFIIFGFVILPQKRKRDEFRQYLARSGSQNKGRRKW